MRRLQDGPGQLDGGRKGPPLLTGMGTILPSMLLNWDSMKVPHVSCMGGIKDVKYIMNMSYIWPLGKPNCGILNGGTTTIT